MGLYSNLTPLDPTTGPSVPEVESPAVSAEPTALAVGDSVLWKGFVLTVLELRPDGCIRAGSQQWHVTVSDPAMLEKAV